MAEVDGGISKSAKKRAAKKARDESFADEQAAAAVAAAAAAPKAKGKAKAAPAPEAAQPKAKAKGKAAPEPPTPEPKAKAKAKSQPEAAPKAKAKAKADPAPPSPPPPAPAPKAQSKQKAKAKAAPAPVEEELPKERDTELINYFYDDKANDDSWEVAVSKEKKQLDRRKAQQVQAKDSKTLGNQKVVGGSFIEETPVKGQKGPSQNVAADVQRILAMKGEAAEEQAEKPEGKAVTVTSVNVPENRIGVVIGPKGANVQLLQEKTKTKIDTSGGVFTITGEADGVLECEKAIQDLVSKGYCALMYEAFTENVLSVHPSCFPDLIGKEGKIVRKIKEALKVEVNFQDVPKGSAPSKKGKVSLAGKADDVEEAKKVINNIMTQQHDELTHPGLVHETVDIEPWAYRYIIGKAGSELKHIQHNWRVKVSIPRDNSPFEQVLVVGEPDQVMRAKAYIDKLVWNAENNAKGRDRQDGTAADPWGEEEDEEPWMKQYMYKRN